MITGADIVQEARTWLGTPYHHQGRVRSAGVDCIGVVIGVAHALGLSEFDTRDYGRIPNGNMMRAMLMQHLDSVPLWEHQAGDIGLFTFVKEPQHVGIFTENGILHAYADAKQCVEHGFIKPWPQRLVAVFRFKGVA
jgi:NlpC/P60 family putative phage cell wall peptidase